MPSAFFLISYARRRRPQMSTLSTTPPSLRTTLRYLSSDGSTVRSSRLGSRMTMTSYARKAVSTSSGLGGHGLSVAGGLCRCATPPLGGRRDRLTTRYGAHRILAHAGVVVAASAGAPSLGDMTEIRIGAHVEQTDPIAEAKARSAPLVQFFLGNPQSFKGPVVAYAGGAQQLRTGA